MAAEDGIYMDHGQAMSFSQEMMSQTQRIRSIVSTLEGEINQIVNSWLGPDKDVYFHKVQPTWEAEVTSLSTILQSHATTLDNISDNYKKTVQQNAQGFDEIKF
jgi:WXG100 family type VII secretion target